MGIFPRIWYDMAYDMGILSYYGYYHHIWGYQSWCGYDMEIVVQYRKNWHYLAFHQDGSVMDSHGDIWTIWRLLGFSGDQPFWVAPLGALQIWESKPGMVNSKIAGSSGCSPANVFLIGIDPSASLDLCRASCKRLQFDAENLPVVDPLSNSFPHKSSPHQTFTPGYSITWKPIRIHLEVS